MADLIFIVIMIISIIIGRINGFLKGLVNLFCVLASCIGGYLLYPYVTSFLADTPLFNTINNAVVETIRKNYINGNPIENLNDMLLKYNVSTVEDVFLKMSEGITYVILNVISIIVVFVALRLILLAVKGIANLVSKLPVISSLDKLMGSLTGLLSGLLIVYLLVAVMMIPPCNKSELSIKMCEEIDKSFITKRVMDYNIFINYRSLYELGSEI